MVLRTSQFCKNARYSGKNQMKAEQGETPVLFINTVMQAFNQYLTEIFDFTRQSISRLHPSMQHIEHFKGGVEKNKYIDDAGKLKEAVIPFNEHVFHVPIEGAPEDRKNLWVSVLHYPGGYGVSGLRKSHLQVHFDVSHVTPEMYRAERSKVEEPAEAYENAFRENGEKTTGSDWTGNQFKDVKREGSSGISTMFRKIVPHIIRATWNISKQHPNDPVAFGSGSADPGSIYRKYYMYGKMVDVLKHQGFVKQDTEHVRNKYAVRGINPYLHVVHPIHEE